MGKCDPNQKKRQSVKQIRCDRDDGIDRQELSNSYYRNYHEVKRGECGYKNNQMELLETKKTIFEINISQDTTNTK